MEVAIYKFPYHEEIDDDIDVIIGFIDGEAIFF